MAGEVVLCDPCLFVETEAKASGFCEKCVEYLCAGCINEHRKGKMTRNHKVQEENMPQNAEVIKAMNEMKLCQFHKEMNITYRCNDHGICVCTVCRVDSHRNCKNVFEFVKSEHADEDLEKSLRSFAEVEEAAASTRRRKEDNKTSLCQSQDEILSKQENIIQQAIKELEEMKSECRKETAKKVQAAVCEIEQDIEAADMIKRKSSKNREILEAAMKYDDGGGCAHVLAYLLKDEADALKDRVKKIQQNGNLDLKFEGNLGCINVSSLVTVSIQHNDTKDTEPANAPTARIEETSDELLETEIPESTVSDKTTNITFQPTPTMCNIIDTDVKLYRVSELKERSNCNIYGSVVLPDGKVVLIDRANSSIKLMSSDLDDVLHVLKLPGKPIRVCAISSCSVAVSFGNVKRINRFTVNENTMSYDGGFTTSLFNHGIAFDGSNIVAIMSDVDYDSNNNSRTDVIQIEVRNAFSGSVVDMIKEFKFRGRSLILRNTQGICFAEDGSLVIVELNRVMRFVLTEKSSKTVAVEQNFYVCSGDIEKDSLQNVTADKDSVYVCTNSGKVLQMFVTDFNTNRVILKNVDSPIISISVDNNNNRIILGCEEDDNIHVYTFTRSPCVTAT